jgi:hypothetical protein
MRLTAGPRRRREGATFAGASRRAACLKGEASGTSDPAQTLACLVLATITGLLQDVPGLDFVLQLAGLGGLIGTGHALLLRRRRPEIDLSPIVAGWTLLAAVAAILIQLASEVRLPG